jgi:hypothetical protein
MKADSEEDSEADYETDSNLEADSFLTGATFFRS